MCRDSSDCLYMQTCECGICTMTCQDRFDCLPGQQCAAGLHYIVRQCVGMSVRVQWGFICRWFAGVCREQCSMSLEAEVCDTRAHGSCLFDEDCTTRQFCYSGSCFDKCALTLTKTSTCSNAGYICQGGICLNLCPDGQSDSIHSNNHD